MNEQNPLPRKRRRIRLFHILFFLFLIAVCVFTIYRVHLKNKLRSKIEAIRVAGYPLTMEELKQLYPVPDGEENAAEVILDAMYDYYKESNNEDIQKLLSDSGTGLPAHTKPYSSEIVTHMGQFLNENEKALEMLHKVSGLQYSRYPEDLNDPNRPGKGLLLLVLESIKLLNLEAIYYSESGDSELALRSITSSFDIADSLAKGTMSICHVVRMLCYSRNISILKHIMNRVDFTEEQLITLDKSVTDALNFSDFQNIFKSDMCREIEILNNDKYITIDLIPNDVPLPIAQIYMFFYKHSGIVDTDRILYLDYIRQYIEAAKLPLQKRYIAFREIDGQIQKLSKIHFLTSFFPMYNRTLDRDNRFITQIQTAKAAIAVKRYYLAEGSLPGSLNDLIGTYLDEIPVTTDGKELKYKKIDEGCIIYTEGDGKININKAPPQSDLIKHGIQNLGEWFVIEYKRDGSK